jgi:hypothetical protein
MDVKINGELLDSSGAIIAITKQNYDFTDFSKRFIGRSNQFTIEKTTLNKKIFKKPDEIATNSDSFEQSYKCDVIDNGVTLLKGNAILDEAGKNYKLQVIDRAKFLFNLLESKLNDLNVEDSDFTFSSAAQNVLHQPNNTVWLWGADCQHISKSITKTIFEYNPILPGSQDVRYSRPHFNVRELIDRIFEEKGWEFLDFDGDDKLNSALITSNHEEFYVTSYEKILTTDYTEGSYTLSGLTTYEFKQTDVVVTNTTINIKQQNAAFRLRGDIIVQGQWEITFTATSSPLGEDVTVQSIVLNDTDTFIDFTTSIFKTDESDNYVEITIKGSGTGATLDLTDVILYNIIKESSFDDLSTYPLEGFKVKTYDNLIDISQIEFLKEMWTIFGIGINVNQVEKKIIPFAYRNFSRENAVDWSGKYVEESAVVYANMAPAKKNYFLYDNDNTLPILEGSENFQVENENIPESVELFKSFFSASQQIQIQGNDIFSSYYFTVSYMPIYNNTSRENKLNPRILLYRPDTSFPNLGVGTFFSSFSSSSPAESPEGISFKNVFNNDYAKIIQSIQKNRLVKANFVLSKLDIVSFDFSKLMYCEDLKSFFFVIKINNFIPGRETTCEILKLN